MRSLLVALACTVLLLGTARAQVQTSRPETFPTRVEVSAHMGYQAGIGGYFGNPSGFKLQGEFAYRFAQIVWFDVMLQNVFGFGDGPYYNNGVCVDRFGNTYACGGGSFGGWGFGIFAGVKLKIPTPIPLVVEVPIQGGIDILYNRGCSDGGAAIPVLRSGAGVKYFITNRIGVGGGFGLALGPGFHGGNVNGAVVQGNVCGNRAAYTDFYGAFDFLVGAEFIL